MLLQHDTRGFDRQMTCVLQLHEIWSGVFCFQEIGAVYLPRIYLSYFDTKILESK